MAIFTKKEKTDFAALQRQKEQNRKKKLKKKAAKLRRKDESKVNGKDEVVEQQTEIEILDFELKGGFERFKLETGEPTESTDKLPSHTEINLKARTAALLEEEQKRLEQKKKYPGFEDDDDVQSHAGLTSKTEDGESVVNGDGAKGDGKQLSKKKLKLLNRPSVSSLKRAVSRPDVVEMWDVCAKDPMLLVYLKSYRNTVPVPRHWCAKRKYLQGKRGYEKPPFRLPDYIARTGIMEMRQVVQDKDADKNLKAKMRDKIRPKVGRVDIDYHKLHDAFFKYQTKPLLTGHGDLYYEGREFEIKLKEKKPGNISDDLRTALGLPVGPNSEKYPPPWLIAMQRYGPPPSYPNLKVPGLNAPIPAGCAFGYHPGGWGKPPVDELGRPIYGDVFGNGGNVAGVPPPPPTAGATPGAEIAQNEDEALAAGRVALWGEWESDEEESDEEAGPGGSDDEAEEAGGSDMDEDEDVAPEKIKEMASGLATPATMVQGMVTPGGGFATPSGASSFVGQGIASTEAANIELRKKTIEEQMEGTATPSQSQLYHVLPERDARIGANEMMGSAKLYDVSSVQETAQRGIEAENPRDRMIRKRTTQEPSEGGESAVPANKPQPTNKKYKEFKF